MYRWRVQEAAAAPGPRLVARGLVAVKVGEEGVIDVFVHLTL